MNRSNPYFRWQGGDLYLQIRVTPRAKRSQICEVRNGAVQVRLNSPPVDGKANQALAGFFSQQFDVARGQVELLKGTKSRNKQVVIRRPQRLPPELDFKEPTEEK